MDSLPYLQSKNAHKGPERYSAAKFSSFLSCLILSAQLVRIALIMDSMMGTKCRPEPHCTDHRKKCGGRYIFGYSLRRYCRQRYGVCPVPNAAGSWPCLGVDIIKYLLRYQRLMDIVYPDTVNVRGFLQKPHLEHRFMLTRDGVAEIPASISP